MKFGRIVWMLFRLLRGPQGRSVLDGAEVAARRATKGRYDDRIRQARRAAGKALGHEGPGGRRG
ncbi:antitoxin [Brevibacterium album]|uniref:antitoxin n=1 Tax=Brevibacterium album TaxID=417948 RepID=UPI0004109467|nr:antitoxin [Brevibacterium album]